MSLMLSPKDPSPNLSKFTLKHHYQFNIPFKRYVTNGGFDRTDGMFVELGLVTQTRVPLHKIIA